MLDRSRSRDRSKTGGAFSPAGLFVTGAQGAWYDPSDFSTLFQDSGGTTPVTAVEQPVRLMLDRSRGLVLGSELVTNGDFSNGNTGWNRNLPSWDATTGVMVNDGSNVLAANVNQSNVITAGKTYRIVFDFSRTSGSLNLWLAGSQLVQSGINTSGSKTFTVVASVNGSIFFEAVAGAILSIDNVSVRELPGNHVLAPNDASRPVLRATNRLDFDGSDDRMAAVAGGDGTTGLLFVAGINLDAVGAASTIWSDTGTNTGYRVRINASNEVELSAGNGSAYTTVTTAETLASGTNYVIAAWHDGTNLNARLGLSGAIAQAAFATATAGTAAFTLGMDNGATSSFLNGKIYNAVYVRNFAGTLSDVNATAAYVSGTMA